MKALFGDRLYTLRKENNLTIEEFVTNMKLKFPEIKKLYQEINKVIKKAIANRGTTFNNYVDSAGKKGNFSRLLKVYGRGKLPCPKCQRPLIKTKLAGRGTHYCDYCQK